MRSLSLLAVLTLSSIPACHSTDAPPTEQPGLSGRVVDVAGNPIAGIDILVNGALSAQSDARGLFYVADIFAEVVVRTESAAYSTAGQRVRPRGNVLLTVKPMSSATLADAAAGGVVQTSEGLEVAVDAAAFRLPSGDGASGAIEMRYALVNQPGDVAAAPGGMAFDKGDGSTGELESFGMADVRFYQGDSELTLDGKATLTIPMAPHGFAPGETVGLYTYDEDAGSWRLEGDGRVEASSAGARFVADVSHFSWWNCDKPLTEKNCVRGTLDLPNGAAARNVYVRATGEDYLGGNTGVTQDDGGFCLDVKRGSLNALSAFGRVGELFYVWGTSGVGVSDAAASCDTGGCLDIGANDVQVFPTGCARVTFTGLGACMGWAVEAPVMLEIELGDGSTMRTRAPWSRFDVAGDTLSGCLEVPQAPRTTLLGLEGIGGTVSCASVDIPATGGHPTCDSGCAEVAAIQCTCN